MDTMGTLRNILGIALLALLLILLNESESLFVS